MCVDSVESAALVLRRWKLGFRGFVRKLTMTIMGCSISRSRKHDGVEDVPDPLRE
jgi:hypothetical protein